MRIKQIDPHVVMRLPRIILILLFFSIMALGIKRIAMQTFMQDATALLPVPLTQRTLAQAASIIAGDYSGQVTLNYAATGTFRDRLDAPAAGEGDGNGSPYLGMIDLAMHLTQEGNTVSGYILLDKTYVFPEMHSVALRPGTDPTAVGPRVSGTLAGTTLELVSEEFTTQVSEQSVTRQLHLLVNAVPQDGITLNGEYRETVWGFGQAASTVVGDASIQRPEYGRQVPLPDGNRFPLAVDDFAETTMGKSITVNVISNDIDPDGDPIRITAVAVPENGTTTSDDTTIFYTPDAGFVGTDRINYTIADSTDGTASATLSITVKDLSANRPPVTGADTATTIVGTAVTINVLANDSDPDGDTLTVTILQQPEHGSATVNGSTIIYTPDAGYSGTDLFAYMVTDSKGATASASVTITVKGSSDSPAIYLPLIQNK